MLAQWEIEGKSAQDRVQLFIALLIGNQSKILSHGCPVGTLCMELAKLKHSGQGEANAILDLFREWLRNKFEEMGRSEGADALALHLLARSQGVAVLAQSLRDKDFVRQEVDLMTAGVQFRATAKKASAGRSRESSLQEGSFMFCIFLKFSNNKGQAARRMAEHKRWIDQGFEDAHPSRRASAIGIYRL